MEKYIFSFLSVAQILTNNCKGIEILHMKCEILLGTCDDKIYFRDLYHSSNLSFLLLSAKRGNLDQLIAKLMQLSGSGANGANGGRASMMRFGAGKRK